MQVDDLKNFKLDSFSFKRTNCSANILLAHFGLNKIGIFGLLDYLDKIALVELHIEIFVVRVFEHILNLNSYIFLFDCDRSED
jgi:hypothetical protein